MARTKYVIKCKLGSYYQKEVFKGQYHFVADIYDAHKYNTIKEANKRVNSFNKPNNFEVKRCKV